MVIVTHHFAFLVSQPVHHHLFRQKRRFQAEQIIGKLREAEVEISRGQTVGQVVKDGASERAIPLSSRC